MQSSKKFDETPPNYVCLGYISGIFGTRGEVRVFLYNPQSETLKNKKKVLLIDEIGKRQERFLRVRSGAGKKIIGTLQGLADREGFEYTVILENGVVLTTVQEIPENGQPIPVNTRVIVQMTGGYQRVLPAEDLPTEVTQPKGIKFKE